MKKATAEARLRKGEEKLEKRRAEYVEQIRNEMAYAHKKGDEKRAKAEVNKGKCLIRVEEEAAIKHHTVNHQLSYHCPSCLKGP
ncbi:remorin 1.4-like [Cryptomeria japonica]|uniref:remorin 1.4-like n=1 Tax=Cryptomeria japonica TaxID=3369 RepID=UPI0025ABFAF3|nr:remorin 1.4-like [Cryptomeria japonica]